MMDICRICLSNKARKDVSQLKTRKKDDNKDYSEIFQFCLDIQVTEEPYITKKLCTPCMKKTRDFYQFKCMALKNDSYLRSIAAGLTDEGVKLEPVSERDDLLDISQSEQDTNQLQNILKTEETSLITLTEISVGDVKPEYNEKCAEDLDLINVCLQEVIEQDEDISEDVYDTNYTEADKNYDDTSDPGVNKCSKKVKKKCRKKIVTKQGNKQSQNFLGYPCKFCDRLFRSMSVRRRHVKFTHEGVNGHCDICNKNVKHLKNHINLMHDPNQLKFECDSCGKRYVTKYRLKYHACHKREKNFSCSECNKMFWCPREIDRHIRSVHEGEKSFLCQFCSKSFFRKSHLIIHLRSHTKEKPYKCQECDKSFSTGTGLKQHKYTHSESHEFQCNQCAKTFAGPKYLHTHMQTHSKERKYPCKYCGVSFMRSDTRKTHENNVHEKNLLSLC